MSSPAGEFHTVARWAVVNTTASGWGHPKPRRRHRKGSKLGFLHVRVTRAEVLRWKRMAARHGLSLSEYVRAMMNDTPVRVVATADPAMLEELRRHGNNLNQLMHAINGGLPVAADRIEATLSALQALYVREIGRG